MLQICCKQGCIKYFRHEEVEDLTQMKADYPAEIIQDPFLINRIVLSYRFRKECNSLSTLQSTRLH